MSVELYNRARTRQIKGAIYLERWLQIDAGTDQIYGNATLSPALAGDLNTLDALCDSSTTGSMEYGAPSPGEYDAGESNPAWYGQAIRIPFLRLQASNQWHTLKTEAQAFVERAFPDELILEANRRFDRPDVGDPSAPAKYVIWTLEYD